MIVGVMGIAIKATNIMLENTIRFLYITTLPVNLLGKIYR